MATDNSTDPGAAFREFVTQWERNFNSLANQFMGTESFSRAMQGAQKAQLGIQQTISDVMSRQLAALSMPTRDDVIRIGEKVQQIDRRLARIETLLERGASVPTVTGESSRRPRTKKPPADYLTGEVKS